MEHLVGTLRVHQTVVAEFAAAAVVGVGIAEAAFVVGCFQGSWNASMQC